MGFFGGGGGGGGGVCSVSKFDGENNFVSGMGKKIKLKLYSLKITLTQLKNDTCLFHTFHIQFMVSILLPSHLNKY